MDDVNIRHDVMMIRGDDDSGCGLKYTNYTHKYDDNTHDTHSEQHCSVEDSCL